VALLGGLTSGQNRRPGAVSLHALDCEWKPVWSLLPESWDLTEVLREESRSLCLLPWHGRREMPLTEKDTKSRSFSIQSQNCKKDKEQRS